jgi:hypothetical protein
MGIISLVVQQPLDELIGCWLAKKAEKILKKVVFNENRNFSRLNGWLLFFF